MQNIFSEFKPVSAAQWKEQLIKDLKGENYDDLIWHNENGFDVQPFYTAENLKHSYLPAFSHNDWEIGVHSTRANPGQINKQLLEDLNRGVTSVSIQSAVTNSLAEVLNGIQLQHIKSVFYANAASLQQIKSYLASEYTLTELSVSLINEDNTQPGLQQWYHNLGDWVVHENIRYTSIDVLWYHNLNCDAYYELAIVFSQLVEHLEILAKNKTKLTSKPVIKTGVNADYFIQIAKLRATRRLWEIIKKEYGVDADIYIVTETSLTNKTIADNYNNLLRTTIEAMAAVSGGCNELVVNHFDVLFPVNTKLAQRMSINQQLVLKNESYFDKMADVACGSFFIESITDAIAEKALNAFKEIEAKGGYFACAAQGVFESEIAKQAVEKEKQFTTQKQTTIGVNKFRNEKEIPQLSQNNISYLKSLGINNPAMNYELEIYFNK